METYLYSVLQDWVENLKSDFLYPIDKNYRQGQKPLLSVHISLSNRFMLRPRANSEWRVGGEIRSQELA
jgi:hypothetical protein